VSYLRHASRHAQETICDYLETVLTTLGWTGSDPPFGASPFVFRRTPITEAELDSIKPNLIAVTFLREDSEDEEELGGGLLSVDLPFAVDCIGTQEAIALTVASDLKDYLGGRVPGSSRFLTVVNQITATPVTDYRMEFLNVGRLPLERNLGGTTAWHVVNGTAELTYVGND
jgi:hypothetical protein